jgi:hypothetical protein
LLPLQQVVIIWFITRSIPVTKNAPSDYERQAVRTPDSIKRAAAVIAALLKQPSSYFSSILLPNHITVKRNRTHSVLLLMGSIDERVTQIRGGEW